MDYFVSGLRDFDGGVYWFGVRITKLTKLGYVLGLQ